MQPITKLIASVRCGEVRWLNYLLASGLALGSDAGLFLLLLDAGLSPVTASAPGYCAGILVHWVVSSRLVFADGAAARGTGERHRQKLLFVGSAFVGLALTTPLVAGGRALRRDPRPPQLRARVVSFPPTS